MITVGVAGPIGAGKSTLGRALQEKGAVVVDADQVARDVLAPGRDGEAAVLQHFGRTVTGPDGRLDRKALAQVVFTDPAQRLALEAITHPLIRAEINKRVEEAAVGDAGLVVIELPLLDAGRRQQYGLDVVVAIEVPDEVAIARAASRGLAADEARARLAAQPSREERRAAADRVLFNTGTIEELQAQADHLWRWLSELSGLS